MIRTHAPRIRFWISLFVIQFLLLVTAACAGSIYKVRPAANSPMPADVSKQSGQVLAINAVAMTSDEFSQETFEANIPLSGLLPVRVELINNGSTEVSLNKTKTGLRDGSGAEWKSLTNKQTAAAIMKANGVSFYTPGSRSRFRDDLAAHQLDLSTPLAANEHRNGLIFFKSPKQRPVESPTGLILWFKNPIDSIEVKLN